MKMKKKITIISLVVIIIFAGIIIYFNQREKEAEVIKIGAILPLTGSGGFWGENARKGILLALEKINNNGGINKKRVEVIFEDSKSVPNEAVNAFRKLIDVDKIQCSIVDMISSNVLAVAPIAEEKKVVIISPGASSPDITNAGKYTFRNWPSDALQGEELAKITFSKGFRKVGILYIENAFGNSLNNVFTKTFKEFGGFVIVSESFKQGESNFKSQIAKIKVVNPEAIVIFTYPPEGAKLIKQIKEAGIKAQLFSTAEIEDPIISKMNEAEGLIYLIPETPDSTQKERAEFLQAYREKYKEDPGIVADVAYDAFNILCKVISEYGNYGPAIQRGLTNIKNYRGASGIITFDENGDIVKPFKVKIIKNHKFTNF
jgi:ABC-type branched-subunit amino acid transport system substrate-binding protein